MNNVKALPAHLFPDVNWFAAGFAAGRFNVSTSGLYQKQKFFNKYIIGGPNGLQSLIVPVEHTGMKKMLVEARISEDHKWRREHMNALRSAYGKAPFYEFYDYKIKNILNEKHVLLIDLIKESISALYEMLDAEIPLKYCSDADFRIPKQVEIKYSQVFEEKFGFRSGLSAIDLIFNHGPMASEFLRNLSFR